MASFSTRPLYLQLHDAPTERVASGQWKPRQALPNEGELAREFDVSVGTMRKALDLMEAERLVTRRQGRGTFGERPHGPRSRLALLQHPNSRRPAC